MSTEYKICTHPECEYDGKPQLLENFYNNKRANDGKSQWCKQCIIRDKKQRNYLKNELIKLRSEDSYQFMTEVACFYITGANTNRILSLFQINKDQLEKILRYEEVFEYRICKECSRLKHFDDYYKKTGKDLRPNCKSCSIKIRQNNKKSKIYKIKSNYSTVEYSQYYEDNLGYADPIRNNNNILETRCTYCGEWFKSIRRSLYTRIQSLNGNNVGEARLYCSEQCKQECPIYGKPAAQLIKEDMVRAGRISPQELNREVQPELRQMVFARDNYTCQKCNIHRDDLDNGLHCHHIEGIRWSPLESADVDHCITVCVKCHKKIHKIPGCNYYEMRCNVEDMNVSTTGH